MNNNKPDYNNLDALLNRANEFNKIGNKIFDTKDDQLYLLGHEIDIDNRLKKIINILRILKMSDFEEFDFDEVVKNIDPNFMVRGEKLAVKFEGCPLELELEYWDDEILNHSVYGPDEQLVSNTYKLYNLTLNNIENFSQNFINRINYIFKQQDAEFKAVVG